MRGWYRKEREVALDRVRVDERGLGRVTGKVRGWHLRERRERKRNSIIYRDWLKAEDKGAEVGRLMERWGYHRSGDITRIVNKMRVVGSVIPAMAAEVEVLRRVKTEEVLGDGESYRSELDMQLSGLRELRESGGGMVEVEEVEVNSDDGVELRRKRVGVDVAIRRLECERAKSHVIEAEGLSPYLKDGEGGSFERGVEASREFIEVFTRLAKMVRGGGLVEVKAEEVKG